MKIILILIVLLLLKYCTIHSQSYNVTHYNEQNGLSHPAVWSIAQDGEGKMWFGTKNGACVYDGINWKTYPYAFRSNLSDNIKLTSDEKGNIWAFTRSSDVYISYFNGEEFEKKVQSPYFSQSLITSFIVDTINSKRFILAAGFLGEILYCYETIWNTLIMSAETDISRIYSATRKENSIILATDKGLFKFTVDGKISKIDISLPFISKGVFCENKNTENRLFVGGEKYFGYIENDKFIKLTDKLNITYDETTPILKIMSDKQGGFFLGNQFSLNFYSTLDSSIITLGIINGLIAGGATSILVDREKTVWISTLRGVSKISNRSFINHKTAFLNYENEVSSLIEYAPGKILFGGNYGLSFYNGVGYRYIRLVDTIEENVRGVIRVTDLYKDNQGIIWVSAHAKGFFVINKDLKPTPFKKSSTIEGFATSVQEDKNGIIWLATSRHLYTFNGKEVSIPSGFPNEFNVRKIVKLNNNDLLFCTVGMGAYLKRTEGVKAYTSSDKNYKNVFSAYGDINETLYLGTAGGLCEIKNDSIIKSTLNNNLTIDKPIYLIIKDNDNNLWFGTDLGVIKYNGDKLFTYSTIDGLSGNEINRSTGLVDKHNRVWFGTSNGASCYYKEYDYKLDTTATPSILIKNINSPNYKNTAANNINLPVNENDLTFTVLGVSFIDEKENKIRWMLDGYDKQWTTEKHFVSNEIYYDNMSPGTYKLFVQMKNAKGLWGPVTVSPEITINKPFYLRWWFLFICVIALGGVVYSVQHYFEQQKYSYFLKREIDRVTKELKETETNYRETLLKEIHHRVKNNMQIISSLLSLQSSREPDVHLSEIIKESQNRIRSMALIHEKLYQSKKFSELDISSYVGSLVEYLKRVFLVNTAFVKVNLNIEEIYINIDVAIACGLIINELVSNSFKYAFPNNAKGTIFIEIRKEDKDTLFISVKDDGVGIKNIPGLDETDSLGLKLVKMLVKQHRGNYNVSNYEGALFEIKLTIQNENTREQ